MGGKEKTRENGGHSLEKINIDKDIIFFFLEITV